uniref:Thioredoxin domain-containing protein n=1 Tax=Mola mola TaxID=94237 RepID=A0A3Q3XQS5_MOLML
MLRLVLWSALWLALGWARAAGRLYTEEDPLVILSSSSLKSAVTNSSSAWLVQFFSSWCGHCVQYSSTWKALAQDVKEWRRAVGVAVLDCAQEENFDVCKEFGIKLYPTFKVGADREIQSVRQLMVNILQNHTKLDRPDHCPPLEPYSWVDLLPLLGQRSDRYTAIIIEEPESYVGREVILDLLQYSGVEVRRALSSDRPLLDALNITTFPSIYLLHPNATHTHLHVQKTLRFFFSSLLRTLPGVQRRLKRPLKPVHTGSVSRRDHQRTCSCLYRAKVYTADLESGLHYLLRVEMATHSSLEGEELKIFKDFVTLVAKLYPGGGPVVKLMETLSDWLLSLPLQRIPYQAVLDLVDNKMRISGVFLGAELRWVGCQGSRAGLRGYPCSLWTLFHVLTVQHDAAPTALDNTGTHTHTGQVAVIAALRGRRRSLSDDPLFPKAPWPSPSLCPSCHEEKNGVHVWNHDNVLLFLRQHYAASNLSPRYSLTPPRLPAPPPDAGPGPTSRPREEHRGGGGKKEPDRKADEWPQPRPGEERREVVGPGGGGVWILGLGFDSVDMSLCVVLYVCSCLFLMLLFFFFKVRSRRRKLRNSRLHV